MAIAKEMNEVSVSKISWQWLILATLGFWLSSSLLMDLVIMPVLYSSGMMVEPGFAVTGYSVFWVFNRIELLCAALVLTGAFIWRQNQTHQMAQRSVLLAGALLGIVLICTYFLSPQMSGLGLQLNLFDAAQETPAGMGALHLGYWLLEVVKLALAGALLVGCLRSLKAA